MAGPYPPHQGTGALGPQYSDPHPSRPFAAAPAYSPGYANPYPFPHQGPPSSAFDVGPAAYPGPLPPPVPYPKRRRWRVVAGVVVALAAVAGLAAAIVFSVRDDSTGDSVLTASSAQRAIQGYLDALSQGDTKAISRNMLCGLYDGVRDRRSDDALARLSSDAFQKQFSDVEVASVDTVVFASATTAQVLFTMRVVPATGSRIGGGEERQGVAQVIAYNDEILVCSYVLRTAGTF